MVVAVVGGGITGLAAAYRLGTAGHAVTLYEAGSQVGGVVRSERRDGYLVETGPNSLVGRDAIVRGLLDELGLTARQMEVSPTARARYVIRRGRLVALPASPLELLTTPIFSLGAKLSILREPSVPPADPSVEESVADFVRRRFGREALEYAADPFVGGIYAGDPAALSVRHAVPRLYQLEREHGSVLKGLWVGRRTPDAAPGMASRGASVSFPDGMGEIPSALAARLDHVRTDETVSSIARSGEDWVVRVAGGQDRYDAVICACPAHAFERLRLEGEGGGWLSELAQIPHAPVAVVVLGFDRRNVAHSLDGFGLLIPAVERRQLLGVLFSSSMFPGRAPESHAALTAFVGGARQPDLAALPADDLVALVRQELRDLLGVRGESGFHAVVRWPRAIPQYIVGYDRWLRLMDEIEAANPRLVLAGSYRGGIGLGDALRSGLAAALRVGALGAAGRAGSNG